MLDPQTEDEQKKKKTSRALGSLILRASTFPTAGKRGDTSNFRNQKGERLEKKSYSLREKRKKESTRKKNLTKTTGGEKRDSEL